MKLIEALKKIKELQQKASDYRALVRDNCAIDNISTPRYGPEQATKITEFIQGHGDLLKEILRLRIGIQRTNLVTPVIVNLGGKDVSKTIAEWIHRRRDLATAEKNMQEMLSDRGLKEGFMQNASGDQVKVEITRFYDPLKRDEKIIELTGEPRAIDAALEIANAVTDLIEK